MKAVRIAPVAMLLLSVVLAASCGTASRSPGTTASSAGSSTTTTSAATSTSTTRASTADSSGIPASKVQWTGFFGSDPANPNHMYSLLGAGFFRAATSDNIETLISDWMTAHPQAKVVLVAETGPLTTDQPDSKFDWVWLVDGQANLNLELVRQGACGAGTMGFDTESGGQLLVAQSEYDQFTSQLALLEQSAKQDRLGVWADVPTSASADQQPWSIAEPWTGPAPKAPTLFPVKQGGKWGYIDKTGKLVIGYKYEGAWDFSDGMAGVKTGGEWGYIDESGAMVIAPQYSDEQLSSFHDGLARAGNRYIDKTGKVVFENDPTWTGSGDFSEGLAPVWFEYTMYTDLGYIDTSGKLVIKIPGADSGFDFSEGLAAVRLGGVYGYIDRSGKFVIEPQFYYATDFSNGLAVVQYESGYDDATNNIIEKYEIIDKTGRVVKKLEYGQVMGLHDGRAMLVADGGYMDESGARVISASFTQTQDFSGGLASVVGENGKMAYIDLNGKYVWQEK